MKPMISVVVPFYCTPETLFDRCVQSLLSENADNVEVLVIDDGSPEEKTAPLRKYAGDARVRVIYAPHAGVSSARNRGVREAKGDWITFVDSDDYVNRDTFARIAAEIDQYNGDIELFYGGLETNGKVVTNTTFLKEGFDYGAKPEDRLLIMKSALTVGKIPEGYVQRFSYGAPYCKLFRRSFLISENLFFDESVKFAEDTLFSLNVFWKASSIRYHDQFLYYYVDNAQSVTRKYRPGLSADMDVFFDKIREFIEREDLWSELEREYYVRAEFEVGRCFSKEFFHRDSNVREGKKQFREFISKEPYCTGLKRNEMPKRGFRNAVFRFLVKHGCGRIYRLISRMM